MPSSRRGGRSVTRTRVGAGIACGLLTLGSACSTSDPSTSPNPQITNTSPAAAGPSDPPTPTLPAGVLASVSLNDNFLPVGLAAVEGSLWAPSKSLPELARIDPATNRVVQTVDIGQASCGTPLGAFGAVWTMPCSDSQSIVVVDGKSGTVRGRVENAVAAEAAAGSVWCPTYDGTALQRIDPKTLKVRHVIDVSSGSVAFDGHFVWSLPWTGTANDSVAKIDPATNRVAATYPLPSMDSPLMAYGHGALWLKPAGNSTLYRFDVTTGRTTKTRLDDWQELSAWGDQPPVIGASSVWIRVADGIVLRIDPSTLKATGRYAADPTGEGGYPLVAFESLWVANFGSASVWRSQIRTDG